MIEADALAVCEAERPTASTIGAMFMASTLESAIYKHAAQQDLQKAGRNAGWFRVGFLAAASAVAGGMAAAWYYRKTLARLRLAERFPVETEGKKSSEDDF
ncbi:MAG TPA: hypothetical protein VL967_11530 [Terracidiphilus sp.]|nr:hypothetical protein [Terracidiphilus sp.]